MIGVVRHEKRLHVKLGVGKSDLRRYRYNSIMIYYESCDHVVDRFCWN